MFPFAENFMPTFTPIEEIAKYLPYNQIRLSQMPYQQPSFLSTDCSSRNSIDGTFSSNTSEKESPFTKNQGDQTNFRAKYKTEICKYWREKGFCEFGDNCAFAHGTHEVREKIHVPTNYKTKRCKKFYENGYCPYGSRCQFLHSSTQKIQTKNKIVTHLNVNNYTDFLNNVQEFWNKEEKNFFWLYQSKRRPDVFQKISTENKEEIKESMLDISDILLI